MAKTVFELSNSTVTVMRVKSAVKLKFQLSYTSKPLVRFLLTVRITATLVIFFTGGGSYQVILLPFEIENLPVTELFMACH